MSSTPLQVGKLHFHAPIEAIVNESSALLRTHYLLFSSAMRSIFFDFTVSNIFSFNDNYLIALSQKGQYIFRILRYVRFLRKDKSYFALNLTGSIYETFRLPSSGNYFFFYFHYSSTYFSFNDANHFS